MIDELTQRQIDEATPFELDLARLVAGIRREMIEPLAQRLAMIEPLVQRVAELEAELAARQHVGKWITEADYRKGNEVAWDGSSWRATRDNVGCRPGSDDTWRLIAKSGRDGRDRDRMNGAGESAQRFATRPRELRSNTG